MLVSATKSYKNHKFSNLEPQIQKICLIYILIAILFFAHMKVNVAVILDFFVKIYLPVTFISGPLSYYN